MNNAILIDEIKSQSAEILDRLKNRTEQEFSLKDLSIVSDGLFLNETQLTGSALRKVLGALRVKKNFTELSKKMSPEDWSDVSDKIKSVKNSENLYALFSKDENGQPEIIDAYTMMSGKKKTDDASYQQYFDWINESLAKSEKQYALNNLSFNPRGDEFRLTLLNAGTEIDVFGTGDDIWKPGDEFRFTGLSFNYAPFFERLICENGMVAPTYGYGSDISKQTFNNSKIQSTIQKAIESNDDAATTSLLESISHLKCNNVSLDEFFYYRRFIESRNKEGVYDSILDQYFSTEPFYKAYNTDINAKSSRWLQSANSGINGYNFFNSLTYLASHPNEVPLSYDDRLALQVRASKLMFKKALDLEDVATPVNFEYPKNFSMN